MAGDIPDNEALNQGKSFQVSKIFILSKNRLNDFFDPLVLNVLFVSLAYTDWIQRETYET